MARRNDHSREELRQMSLEAAESLLSAEGPGALSVRRIAQSIGYTHGTLYLIFRNLDGLLMELNARTLDSLGEHLENAAAGGSDPGARLNALATAYLDFARRHTARWRLVFEHHLPRSEDTPPWLTERVARGFRTLHAALSEAGAPPATRATLAAALWSAIHGVTVLAVDGKLVDDAGGVLDPRPVLEQTVAAFLAVMR